MEVEDSAKKFGLSPDLESHFARGALGSDSMGASLFRYAPNFRGPFGHRHEREEEVYVVLEGSGRFRVGDDEVEVGQWDAVRVSPEAPRNFEAGPDGALLLAFGHGSSGSAQDAEQLPGWWGENGADGEGGASG
jgi:quercetin dioxygenase-like cupin family protein